jgi:hypothetical protein
VPLVSVLGVALVDVSVPPLVAMLTALLVQRSTSPAGTCSVVHDQAAFFSSSFEHATEEVAAPATRSARSPELRIREEVRLLMS